MQSPGLPPARRPLGGLRRASASSCGFGNDVLGLLRPLLFPSNTPRRVVSLGTSKTDRGALRMPRSPCPPREETRRSCVDVLEQFLRAVTPESR